MVVAEDDDLVAGLEIEAVRHQVVRLAGVARDDDFFRRHPEELGQRLARRLPWRPTGARDSAATGCDRRPRSRASAPRAPAATTGTGWRRSSPPGRAASRTGRARSSRRLHRRPGRRRARPARGVDCAHAGCANSAADPPTAKSRAKSRRDTALDEAGAAMESSGAEYTKGNRLTRGLLTTK